MDPALAAQQGEAAEPIQLGALSVDVLVAIMAALPTVEDVGRVDCTCRAFHRADEPAASRSPVEQALRLRAAAAGNVLPDSLPEGESSWTQRLCWDERRLRYGERAVVASGMYHSVFVEGDGQLLTCGNARLDGGRPGLLGHGEATERLEVPRPVAALASVRVRTVAAAEYHSLAISECGAAFSWGYGGLGRLGHGDTHDQYTPREILLPRAARHGAPPSRVRLCAAAAGSCHTLLLSADAAEPAYTFGYGGSGRLGHGAEADDACELSPRAVVALRGVPLRAVAAGAYHTLALAACGDLYSCGEGGLGQLGHGDEGNEPVPRRVEALRRLGERVTAIAAGRLHSLCVTDSGALYSWGEGDGGRLGHGRTESTCVPQRVLGLASRRVCALSCVWDHCLALSDGGFVYSWGVGLCGQLGHGDEQDNVDAPRQVAALAETRVVAVAAGAHSGFAVSADGTLHGWGIGKTTENETVDTLGLQLERNACVPMAYPGGLRLSRPALVRRITSSPPSSPPSPAAPHASAPPRLHSPASVL